jgi:hypothetical protein
MRRLPVLSIVPVLVLGLGLAACGDDEERLSQDEFVEQGQAICREGNEEIEALFADLPQDEIPTEEELEPLFDDFVSNVRGQIDDIDELSPPEDIEDDVDAFVSDARDALDEVEDGGAEALLQEEGEDPFAEVNEQAAELGLSECAG